MKYFAKYLLFDNVTLIFVYWYIDKFVKSTKCNILWFFFAIIDFTCHYTYKNVKDEVVKE